MIAVGTKIIKIWVILFHFKIPCGYDWVLNINNGGRLMFNVGTKNKALIIANIINTKQITNVSESLDLIFLF